MKAEKDADRVGKEVTVTEKMKILHSVTLSGAPLENKLRVEFLKGDGPEVLVQTTSMLLQFDKRETKAWDLAAIANGDFNGDKLKGLKEYAEEIFPDVEKPVITFRKVIIHESEPVFQPMPARRAREQVVHSKVRNMDS